MNKAIKANLLLACLGCASLPSQAIAQAAPEPTQLQKRSLKKEALAYTGRLCIAGFAYEEFPYLGDRNNPQDTPMAHVERYFGGLLAFFESGGVTIVQNTHLPTGRRMEINDEVGKERGYLKVKYNPDSNTIGMYMCVLHPEKYSGPPLF